MKKKVAERVEPVERIWDAGTGIDQLDDLIEEHVRAALDEMQRATMEDELHGLNCYLPMEWYPHDGRYNGRGRKHAPPDDPLYVSVAEEMCWEFEVGFSLTDRLRDTISECAEDGSFAVGLAKIGAHMKMLAAEIDEAVAVGPARWKEYQKQRRAEARAASEREEELYRPAREAAAREEAAAKGQRQ